MKILWCEIGVKPTCFLIFQFLAFVHIFSGVRLSSVSRKTHGCDSHIFIFPMVCILWKIPPNAYEKKPYVNSGKVCLLMPFGLFLKMLFKGKGL